MSFYIQRVAQFCVEFQGGLPIQKWGVERGYFFSSCMVRNYLDGSLRVGGSSIDVKLYFPILVHCLAGQEMEAVIHFRLHCEGHFFLVVVKICHLVLFISQSVAVIITRISFPGLWIFGRHPVFGRVGLGILTVNRFSMMSSHSLIVFLNHFKDSEREVFVSLWKFPLFNLSMTTL